MKLKIISPKHGEIKYLIDDEDYEKIKGYNWHSRYDENSKSFYIQTNLKKNNKKYYLLSLHRFIMNCPENMVVDHINHNTLDNRKCNLRICSQTENKRNNSKHTKNTTSKYKGVNLYTNGKEFRSYINFNNKRIHLGYFKTEIDAALVYNGAAKYLFKEYANLNIIE